MRSRILPIGNARHLRRLRQLAATIGALALLFPFQAIAYLSPEQVLEMDQAKLYIPSNGRQAEYLIMKQQETATAKHYGGSTSSDSADVVTEDPTTHAAAGDQPADNSTDANSGDAKVVLSPAALRLLQRLEAGNIGNEPAVTVNPNSDETETLHSSAMHKGAPLNPSGPEGPATVIVMLGTVAWTIWRARRLEKGPWAQKWNKKTA